MNRKFIIGIIFSLILVTTLGLFQQIRAENGAPLLWVNPVAPNINIGQTVTVTIQLNDITNVYGIELDMTYNPAVVQVVDADSGTGGVQITPDDCPAPDFVIQNTAYNITGTLNYAAIQFNPTPPCSGGNVAKVAFLGLANGVSPFNFTTSLISDPDGITITHTAQNGLIIVGPTPPPSNTPTETFAPTITATPTITPTPTDTPTPTPTGSTTATPTASATASATATPTDLPLDALLSLQPGTLNIPLTSLADLAVQLDDITNVYGLDILLNFDPAILSVVDANAIQNGVQITPGNCPQPDSVFVNSVDNEEGVLSYAVVQLNPTPPCNGGEVATIQFQCLVGNTSTLVTFTDSIIATSNGKEIPHTTTNAVVNCVGYAIYFPWMVNAP